MAQVVEEGDFRLPSEFLPEDFFLGEETNHVLESRSFYDYEPSNLNSTVESTTETESDDDSYTAGLTRQMTHAFLLHDDDEEQDIDLSTSPVFSSTQNNSKKSWLATSPESALCSTVDWKKVSAKVSFPPFHEQDIDVDDNNNLKKSPNNSSTRAWEDLLSAAAAAADGHASIMRREMELQKRRVAHHHLGIHGLDGPESRPSLIPISQTNNNIRYYGNPSLTHHQLQVSQFYQLRHQQMLKQRQQRHLHQCSLAWGRQTGEFEGVGAKQAAVNKKSVAVGKLSGGLVGFSSSAWPPPRLQPHQHPNQLQQQVLQQGFGMRSVFLSSPAPPKQSCGGTGVFLPRRAGSPNTNFRKRSGCSTVLLPEKVVQALNLDLDEMGPHHRPPGGFLLDPRHEENMMARNKPVWLQKQSVGPRQSPTTAMNRRQYDLLRQPKQQWTYY